MEEIIETTDTEAKAKEIVEALAKEIVSSETVQNAVQKLAEEMVESKVTDESVTTTPEPIQHNPYYAENVPFLVELNFSQWNPETESKLMECFMHDEELLPGLKINKLYKATLHSDSLYLDKITDQLDDIKAMCENYRAEIDRVMRNIVMNSKSCN